MANTVRKQIVYERRGPTGLTREEEIFYIFIKPGSGSVVSIFVKAR